MQLFTQNDKPRSSRLGIIRIPIRLFGEIIAGKAHLDLEDSEYTFCGAQYDFASQSFHVLVESPSLDPVIEGFTFPILDIFIKDGENNELDAEPLTLLIPEPDEKYDIADAPLNIGL